VPRKKEDENDAGEGDDELFPDGGGPIRFEATGKGIHDDVEGVAALAARRNRQAIPAFQEESPQAAESVMRMAGFAEWKADDCRKYGGSDLTESVSESRKLVATQPDKGRVFREKTTTWVSPSANRGGEIG
jgi:hypothetical protein